MCRCSGYGGRLICFFRQITCFKSYSKLKSPTPSVVRVVKVACLMTLQCDVFLETNPTVFKSLQQHALETYVIDQSLCDDHITILIKNMIDLYSKIFLYRFAKVYCKRIVRQEKPSQSHKLTKLILFDNK